MSWQIENIRGGGDLPSLAQSYSGKLLVMGGGRSLWQDLHKINVEKWQGHIMGVNDIIAYWQGPMEHAVSMHNEYMAGWIKFRLGHNYGLGKKPYVHYYKHGPGVDCVWEEVAQICATSGLFGAIIGILLGYEKIILAGVPIDNSGHFFDPPLDLFPLYKTPFEDRSIHVTWDQAQNEFFKNRVRSLSGNTARWIGEPTEDWLHGN